MYDESNALYAKICEAQLNTINKAAETGSVVVTLVGTPTEEARARLAQLEYRETEHTYVEPTTHTHLCLEPAKRCKSRWK
jgi:hypothetical protein